LRADLRNRDRPESVHKITPKKCTEKSLELGINLGRDSAFVCSNPSLMIWEIDSTALLLPEIWSLLPSRASSSTEQVKAPAPGSAKST